MAAADRATPAWRGRKGRPGCVCGAPLRAGRPRGSGRGPGGEETPSVSAEAPTFGVQLEREAERLGR